MLSTLIVFHSSKTTPEGHIDTVTQTFIKKKTQKDNNCKWIWVLGKSLFEAKDTPNNADK